MKAAKWIAAAVIGTAIAYGLYTNAAVTAAAIGAVLVLGFHYVYFIYFGRPNHVAGLDEITDAKWHTVDLGEATVSADGSSYAMFVRRGTSNNLVIHFSGGGACWDGETAARPIKPIGVVRGYTRDLKMFYFNSLTRLFPAGLAGMTNRRDTTNAFRDWNFVFVPYSTGDMHVGDITNTYSHNGKTIKIHHNGRNNCKAVLDWVYANFPAADKVMVSGESAGAWASAFYVPQIADHYTDSKLYCLSDGVGIVTERWRDIVDTTWKADSAGTLGFHIGIDLYEDALLHRSDAAMRTIKYLHSNTLYDDTLTRFGAALNHTSTETDGFIDDWAANTKASITRLDQSGLHYNFFLTDWGHKPGKHTTEHTLTTNEFYNKCTADGVLFSAWIKRNVIDDEDLSLGHELLPSTTRP
ncbi:pectinacetylesterase family protein [Actinoplanes hulinensis]|uniref:Pectinacetylesterase family protein n=1 Tax=Actinoplanes hulinensis TaxID=1144547 RepID=A0ABS7BER9_9ACTN|nr:pectinacetylesterase family protein [Actinoplanes hulinensis]MBW6439350.1 pectinacetylesterase family protein [Actinoplanes hulinensis]